MIQSLKDILVVTDMDNTLLTAKDGIPSCNLETIKLFVALGGKFTVATGRTVNSVKHYLDKLPINVPAITFGGAVIYDFNSKKRITNKFLPKAEALDALLDIQSKFKGVGIEVMAENGKIHVVQANKYTYEHTLHEKLEYTLVNSNDVTCNWNKVLFACDNAMLKRIHEYVSSKRYNDIYFIQTNDIYIEIMSKTASKGTALRELSAYLNIPHENTIAIGDYYNDLELMKSAQYSVAVKNAPNEVKLAANEVTSSCLEGGVGQFLYKLIKQYT